MASNLPGDSLIIKANSYAIEENSCYKNYIIPNSPSFTGTNFIILPISVNKDVRSFRVVNCSSNTLILQSRGIDKPDDLFNLFTIKRKCMVNVEYQPRYKVFRNCWFQTIE